ncbi:predicted protein [Uncinocarpus reesii 1704]|uniref:Uncharacterized protein n=1 Tax=Uncinocarpus reesii (strain UAMH 1704) TaxID=336963 RepID=C4JX08_UNCRE|nr:uncharacterized protein UREG_06181 [Uncinocarpus reesii 1704]EEP81316.1 predicted protein [Uncinocarpus reesii 1704]
MKEKRSLRPDGSPDAKPAREAKRLKQSKDSNISPAIVSRNRDKKLSGQGQAPSPNKTPSKKSKPEPTPTLEVLSVIPTNAKEQELGQLKRSDHWNLSYRSGGRFLNLDPVFSIDEKYIILAQENAVQIYSMSTSTIVRILHNPDEFRRIAGYKLSPSNPAHLFVATHSGHVSEWNWTTGDLIQSQKSSEKVIAIDVIGDVSGDSPADASPILYSICKTKNKKYSVCKWRNTAGTKAQSWKQSVIYQTSTRIGNVRVAANGRLIIATAGPYVVIGQASMPASQNQKNFEYTWRKVRLPIVVSCFDIREPAQPDKPTGPQKGRSPPIAIDLVVGSSDGAILIYHDFANTLLRYEGQGELDAGLVARKLHWHRDRVNTVKWSKDGNYLISGGLETVLVLWQLDTGRKQFLPHLTSPICTVVVSPSGTSYAVKLADNSIMVLSTSELRPTTSMSSLQLPSNDDMKNPETKGSSSKTIESIRERPIGVLPAVLHPVLSDYLLLAVPSSQTAPSTAKSPTASFLQTFDTRSNQHISRQALARTNVSVLHTGPDGTELTTPDVKFVEISSDGDWLVTVDEWEQYPGSLNILSPLDEPDARQRKREIFLKFWHWHETNREWELVTRVDGPHFSPSSGSMPIRGLVANPQDLSFATVGDDGVVRLWKPEYRSAHSRTQGEHRLVKSWRCSQNIPLAGSLSAATSSGPMHSCLGFSEDGSALAVCWAGPSNSGPSLVYIIDPHRGRVAHIREGLYSGIPRGCGFLDRYLVVLSDHLVSLDTVTDQIVFALMLVDRDDTQRFDKYTPLLSLNHRNQTFAITYPTSQPESSKSGHKLRFQVAVLEPTTPNPLFATRVRNAPRALLSSVKSGDYTVVDSTARILQLSSSNQMARVPIETSAIDLPLGTGLENIFGSRRLLAEASQSKLDGNRTEVQHGQTRNLADIFDIGPSFALPDVDVLLKDVVEMYSTKSVEA